MTLVELQNKLGEQVDLLTNKDIPLAERQKIVNTAQIVSSLAKQMINNADVVLRTEKLISEGKLKDSAIKGLIK